MHFNELVPILNAAIGPVILISGVGMLLLTMTNRYGRILDRSRQLAEAVHRCQPTERGLLLEQLTLLTRRARLVRMTISFATFSILLAAILVITLFLTAFLKVDSSLASVALFIGCMLSLITSLILFLLDINLSLAALKLELHSIRDDDR
jgi:hypothetical protein